MELELGSQAAALLLSLLAGGAIGLVYDLLRPVRHRMGGFGAAALDTLFCLLAFFLAFSFAMGAGSGRLGQWELAGMLMGFLIYMHMLSDSFLQIFELWMGLIPKAFEKAKIILKKSGFSAKFFFQKVRKCFIIRK